MTEVYIMHSINKLLWKGDDWTSSMELAETYEPVQADKIINKRWHKGIREYKKLGDSQAICYNPKPVTQTKEELGRWDRI